ncbi:methionine/alanine import family NSS transporter small subunit [Gordonia zhaorongruii]|uniref:methionine/alanine import family NSS transporter small subunit n=1 Tax=Gordonia zhaorongruii TaxID=2597659 RepID=UPI00104F8D0E|nr:methionine/alanine import family NSS transporter small subunit [Gordonia zhaorongruii]
MTTSAIVLLVIAAVIVWGGLVASVIFLNTHPEVADLPDVDGAQHAAGQDRETQPHPTRDT